MNAFRRRNRSYSIQVRLLSAVLAVFVMISAGLFSGCSDASEEEEKKPADFGDYGEKTALMLATSFPERYAYSQKEREAGVFIKEELIRMGYTVEEQKFSSSDLTSSSTNYIVRIPGEGFMLRAEGEQYSPIRRTVVVGAHYDMPPLPSSGEEPADDEAEPKQTEGDPSSTDPTEQVMIYDGLQSNASGVACLLTIAERMRVEKPAYDVILVAFGASSDDFRGARSFLNAMSSEEKRSIDVMYCIESIYAGDKLYASSGISSLIPGKKYEYRRKLYEAYDVVYNNMLRSRNNIDLFYNMSGLYVDLNGDEIPDIYREVTFNRSDYVPFDEARIPIVFFESYEYNATVLSEMKETKNLNLQEEGGLIRGTHLDSSAFLEKELGPDRLTLRINNTAFIIIAAIRRGVHNAVPVSLYNAGERLAPIIRVTETVPYQSQKKQ
ncbi:MAG: M28 family peptidase [Oscillospiraceae bacterium]|nr:M28 family peptidase [Oscillospiraceae bacterium]